MLAGHHNARIANLHLGPSTLGDGVDTEQTIAPVRDDNGETLCDSAL
jgi:hypothetical protein